jgi:hypothetical protein
MSYRFTNTDKWKDAWYIKLKPLEKLLFNYLCDNCDIGGFIEVIPQNWASDIGEKEDKIKGALEGLDRGLIYSTLFDAIYLRTFLRHQKNLPLNLNNASHRGIYKRFELYRYKFDIEDVSNFIERGLEGATKGLSSPIGKGKGKGKGKDSTKEEVVTQNWRSDFNTYLEECRGAFRTLVDDEEFLKKLRNYHPGFDIIKSMGKSFNGYWGTETGWQKKKQEKTTNINWKATIINSLKFSLVKE